MPEMKGWSVELEAIADELAVAGDTYFRKLAELRMKGHLKGKRDLDAARYLHRRAQRLIRDARALCEKVSKEVA